MHVGVELEKPIIKGPRAANESWGFLRPSDPVVFFGDSRVLVLREIDWRVIRQTLSSTLSIPANPCATVGHQADRARTVQSLLQVLLSTQKSSKSWTASLILGKPPSREEMPRR